ncbi:MAG: anti-sigma factor [Saprospiraceae bacterium]|nr:anti-sigma factor [Saprospiraceae bacterium]MCB0676688.1 anti-sigma factor [Saprospiraceae bacterium]
MNKEEFLTSGLIEQYVLGLTSPEEDRIVERFAEEYPEIEAELRLLQKAMERYAEQHTPPRDLPPEQVADDRPAAADRSLARGERPLLLPALGIVSLLLLGSASFWQYRLRLHSERQNLQIRSECARYREQCDDQLRQLQAVAAHMEFLQTPGTQYVALQGSGVSAVALWNEERQKGLIFLGTLPKPPSGHTYQIWADVDGEMIDAGLIDAERACLGFQEIYFIRHAESLNITLEPSGGSETPTVALLQANGPVG